MKYTEDELDYLKERVSIMIYDGGLSEKQAKEEAIKLIKRKRYEVS